MDQNTATSVIDFSGYIVERTRDFTDRRWVYEAINKWLGATDAPPFFLLTGEPGSGKTAIAARLIQFSQRHPAPPADLSNLSPNFLSAAHFCSVHQPDWINPFEFAESIASQLASRYPAYRAALMEKQPDQTESRTINVHVTQKVRQVRGGQVIGVSIKVSAPTPEDAFMRVVRKPLKALTREEDAGQVVILVDALDESLIYSGKVGIIALLAQLASDDTDVRFLLTSRPEEETVLSFLENRSVWEVALTADGGRDRSLEDVKRHVLRVLKKQPRKGQVALASKLDPQLSAKAFARHVRDKSEGNFLYLYYLLPMLEAQAEPITQASLDALPTGLDAIYREFLGRLVKPTQKEWGEDYRPVLGTLAVAREPLNERQVAGIVGRGKAQTRTILGSLHQFLDVDTSLPLTKRRYAIYHRSFADFLLDEERAGGYWCDAEVQHQRIVDFCQDQADGWEPEQWEHDPVAWDVDDNHVLAHWVEHLEALLALAEKSKERRRRAQDLYARALDETFQRIQLDRLGDSGATLANLRAALNIALERNEMVTVLACAGSYRSTMRNRSIMDAVFKAVEDGDFDRALQRAGLSGATPPWAAALYHYLAWEAALVGNEDAYHRALQEAARFPQDITRKLCSAFQAQSKRAWNPATDLVSDFLASWDLSTVRLDSDAVQQRLDVLQVVLTNLEAMVERGEAEGVGCPWHPSSKSSWVWRCRISAQPCWNSRPTPRVATVLTGR